MPSRKYLEKGHRLDQVIRKKINGGFTWKFEYALEVHSHGHNKLARCMVYSLCNVLLILLNFIIYLLDWSQWGISWEIRKDWALHP